MKWSSNNRACKTVWSVLKGLDQISELQPFKSTGEIKIKELTFYPQDAGDDIGEAKPHAFALQLDRVFRNIRRAEYEEGIDKQQAVETMLAVLEQGEETVTKLSDVADDMYLFLDE